MPRLLLKAIRIDAEAVVARPRFAGALQHGALGRDAAATAGIQWFLTALSGILETLEVPSLGEEVAP
jgi:hypothetical protein